MQQAYDKPLTSLQQVCDKLAKTLQLDNGTSFES
jgi:hypothetical protein